MANQFKRRSLLIGGLAGTAAVLAAIKPRDIGGNHSAYFSEASLALDKAGIARPSLIIDRAKLKANVATLRSHIGNRFAYRIVAKSLPSINLLQEIMRLANSNRLMLFHQPFLSQVAQAMPTADVLMGKPMPVAAAKLFYQSVSKSDFNHQAQLQWLVDTPERLKQYTDLAAALNITMRINIEIDVGLHRGGVSNTVNMLEMLQIIDNDPHLRFSGLMGYEPHIVKVPGDPMNYRDASVLIYQARVAEAKEFFGDRWPVDVTLNAAGSPTYQMYDEGDYPFNELSAGSCLVKPTDFDLPTLADHVPASFIAAPVLKTEKEPKIPVDGVGPLMSAWNPNRRRSFFLYGGYWKAIPESPVGLSTNPLMGRSTNQELLNGSDSISLQPDDWVFLRPTQSEFVFLQFGDIAVLERGRIVDYWPVFV